MIVTRKCCRQLEEAGCVLVHSADVPHFERYGVPLYTGREAGTETPCGPWAPKWALSLLASLSPVSLEAEPLLRRAIGKALLQDNPTEFAEGADAATRLGGLDALTALLETPP